MCSAVKPQCVNRHRPCAEASLLDRTRFSQSELRLGQLHFVANLLGALPLKVESLEEFPFLGPQPTDCGERSLASGSFIQMSLRIPRDYRFHVGPIAFPLVNVLLDALRSYAESDREARTSESIGIAHFGCEFECPHKRLFNGVLPIAWPQPAEKPKSPSVQPFVQLQHCRVIERHPLYGVVRRWPVRWKSIGSAFRGVMW